MLRVAIAFAGLFAVTDAATFLDLNCTNRDTTTTLFIASATACDDKYTTCPTLYTPAALPGGGVDRSTACFQSGGANNEDAKQMAIATCPKSCGYCCLTNEFSCTNKEFPRVKCETVTSAQCDDPIWRQVLAEDCPNVCGFCLTGGCVDRAIQCKNDVSICRQIDMQAFVKVNCQRTCGYCPTATTVASSVTVASGTATCASAVDANANCATWAVNGFCTNTFYSLAQRKQYCSKTCKLC